jgi:UDP-glucose 4-epimerase
MKLKGSNILITGGAGFIGSHIADRLLAEGAHVCILDNLSTGRRENLPAKAAFVQGDIRDSRIVAQVMRGIDIVFHEAAQINPAKAVEDPLFDFDNNVKGTLVLLLAAQEAGVKRFVMASTNVYGNADLSKLPESFSTLAERGSLLSPYAAAKVSAEAYLKVASDELGLPTVRLRYFNVYGPRQLAQSESGVVAIFTINACANKPLSIFGSGNQTRDFVYVDDVVEANILAVRRDRAVGGVFNVGTGKETSVTEVAELVREQTGEAVKIKYVKVRRADFQRAKADLRLVHKVLGFKPKVTLREGLKRYIRWYKES